MLSNTARKMTVGSSLAVLALMGILVSCVSLPARSFLVYVNAEGKCVISGTVMTLSEAKKKFRRVSIGMSDVVTKCDEDSSFGSVWPIIDYCAGEGFYSQHLLSDRVLCIFLVPSRDYTNSSPMHIEGFRGNTLPDFVDLVRMCPGKMTLKGESISMVGLRRYFKSKADKAQPVVVMPSNATMMGQVTRVLKTIADSGNTTVCLVDEATSPPRVSH
jgi:biopolymer transport protein ExbD